MTEILYLWTSNFHFLFLRALGSYHSTFLFYECDYFRYHKSEIMQYLSFRDWPILLNISSRSIHVVAYVKSSFFFRAE